MKKEKYVTLLAATLLMFQAIGCSSSAKYESSDMCDPGDVSLPMYSAQNEELGFADMSTTSPAGTGLASPHEVVREEISSRKLIKNADLHFETTAYDDFLLQLEAYVQEQGGYVEASKAYDNGIYDTSSGRNARLTVRVPAESYQTFLNGVRSIGKMTYKSEYTDDVTMQYVDTESRILALETEYDTLLSILEKAESMEDVITLQARISDITYELESYRSQLRKYDDLVAYSTIQIEVSEVERVTPVVQKMTYGEQIQSGLSDTWYNIRTDAADFSVWLITSLPYLVIWGAALTLVIFLIRLGTKKHKKKKEQKILEQYLKETNEKKN